MTTTDLYNYPSATLLPDGKLLIAEGSTALLSLDQNGSLLTPTSACLMTTGRQKHTATLLPNGRVLFTGGLAASGALKNVEIYDPATPSVGSVGYMNTVRDRHSTTLLPDGRVLAVGGFDGSNYLNTAETYNPKTDTWSLAGTLLNGKRVHHTATLLANGSVLVVGGNDGASMTHASAELFNPTTGVWSSAGGSMTAARAYHTSTLLADGTVFVIGGNNGSPLASTEVYDPQTKTWTPSKALTFARDNHTATLLDEAKGNGWVLVSGGYGALGPLQSAERFHIGFGSNVDAWSLAGTMTTARYAHSATLLPSGKVLVVGGINASFANNTTAEQYDPKTATWFAVASPGVSHSAHTATMLPNGNTLIAGGTGQNTLEVYDHTRNAWSTPLHHNAAYGNHGATLLLNGKVLITGRSTGTVLASMITSAALFDVGLTPDATRQPLLSSVADWENSILTGPVVSGSGFWPKLEASGGGTNNSASNVPLLHIIRLDNGFSTWAYPDPFNTSPSDSSFSFTEATTLPLGPTLVSVVTNGVPSEAKIAAAYYAYPPLAPVLTQITPVNHGLKLFFTPPPSNGSHITTYQASCTQTTTFSATPPPITATGNGSPITVTGLTNRAGYSCSVQAMASIGGGSVTSGAASTVIIKKAGNAGMSWLPLLLD